ncbi:MAG TPA: prepilin-type N-terminal cleavage/methylation domain-containing protein [Desulfobacterales bacterium]|nr:prepilin-type N-terminal cleavage/methylation domain-containing protein [Desulfobacterales bacterium]
MIITFVRELRKKWRYRGRPRNRSAGFTLVELLVVIAMISVMLAALVGLFTTLSKSYTTEEVKAEAQQDLRAAGDLMIRDIRMAGLDPTLSGNFGIIKAEDKEIRFTMDSDEDGAVTPSNFEDISYNFIGNELKQSLDGGSFQPVIENVTFPIPADPVFIYLDEDDNQIATPVSASELSNIRVVLVQNMTVQPPAGQVKLSANAGDPGSGDVPILNTRIQIRNLWF